MRAPRLLLLVASFLAGCDAATDARAGDAGTLRLPLDPVTRFVGELHLHQFPAGGHAWAAFVGEPVLVSDVHTDQLFSLETAVTASAGTCRLWRRPLCASRCPAGSYCTDTDTCSPFAAITYVDGGPLHITGSRLHDRIELWFAGGEMGYVADPPPGGELLFAGGELLRLEGGAGPTRLAATLPAPQPVRLLTPQPDAPFHLPVQGPLDVVWEASTAAQVVIIISASTSQGDYANIRCVGPDSGQARVPASLLAGLPAPPRSNRIEVERDNELVLKTVTPGNGVLTHVAFSAWMNGSDP